MPGHQRLLDRIAARLGVTSTPRRVPSDEADVYLLSPFVVKVGRPAYDVVAREQVAFPALRAMGFTELPEIVLTQADLDDAGATFMVMPETPSRPHADLWRDDPVAFTETVAAVGNFLGRLSKVDWREVPAAVTPGDQQRSSRTWFRAWLAPIADLAPRATETVLATFDDLPTGFGGWQFMQVLTTGGPAFTAIDFGSIGAFWPEGDLAACIAHVRDFDDSLAGVLLDAYGPVDERALRRWHAVWELFAAAAEGRAGDDVATRWHIASAEVFLI